MVPRIDFTEKCVVEPTKGFKAICGNLVTWENRLTKKRTISLPFIRLKTKSEAPKPDPVVYTAGGPGVGSLRRARGAQYLRAYMAERDFIIFEQRGTTNSKPALECPEVDLALTSNVDSAKRKSKLLSAVKTCKQRLKGDKIDLSAYTTRAIAKDFDELRGLLKIKKWNLFGGSYSTRIMLTIMRDYPEGVRSAILDSPLPLSVNYDETSVDGVVRSLNLLFERCRQDPTCNQKYPGLRKLFYETVDELNKNPVVSTVKTKQHPDGLQISVDGTDLINRAYDRLNYPDGVSVFPSEIKNASEKNKDFLLKLANAKIQSSGFVWGMRYSVWCADEMPFQIESRIASNRTRYARLKGFGIQKNFADICRIWDVPESPLVESKPVISDIPTLVLSGSFDPNTPPEWGILVSENLTNSYFFEFPDIGHLINFNSSCGIKMIGEFLKKPTSEPDAGCIKNEKRIVFK